jgi:hypothetical protein
MLILVIIDGDVRYTSVIFTSVTQNPAQFLLCKKRLNEQHLILKGMKIRATGVTFPTGRIPGIYGGIKVQISFVLSGYVSCLVFFFCNILFLDLPYS